MNCSIKFGSIIRELRIHLCQTSPSSKGVRDFVQSYYVNLKKDNPNFPILIRECQGIQPRLWVRYEKGAEKSMPLTNLAEKDVLAALKQLAK